MALDPERKVKPGDRFVMSAQTYNSLIDMLREYKRNKGKIGAGRLTSTVNPHNTIFVQNNTGEDLTEAFKIVRLSGITTGLQFDPYSFSKRPSFYGYVPETKDDPIAITLAPALTTQGSMSGEVVGSDGSISIVESGLPSDIIPAVVSGVTVALVRLTDLTHEWANPTPDTIDYLTSNADYGQARILYWEALDGSSLIEPSGSWSGASEIVIAVILLMGKVPATKPLYLADYATANNASLFNSSPFGFSRSVNHHITASGGTVLTDDTNIWYEGSSPGSDGFSLTIPPNSGQIEIEGNCTLFLRHSDTFDSPQFAPSQCRFQIFLNLIDINNLSDETPTVLGLSGLVTSDTLTLSGTPFHYAYNAGGDGGAIGVSTNNCYWYRTIPVRIRLPNNPDEMRIAYKTHLQYITDTIGGPNDITVQYGMSNWGSGWTSLTAKGV